MKTPSFYPEHESDVVSCVILLSSDLMFSSRIDSIAKRLGVVLQTAADGSRAVEQCAAGEAALVLLDLSMSGIDPETLIPELRQHLSSTAKIIAYGPHVHEARLTAARNAGCDTVLSRGQFHSQVEQILGELGD